jgi:hypothetical protein
VSVVRVCSFRGLLIVLPTCNIHSTVVDGSLDASYESIDNVHISHASKLGSLARLYTGSVQLQLIGLVPGKRLE